MRLYNEKLRILPFEKDKWPLVWAWYHSGDYENFFGNIEQIDTESAINFGSNGKVFLISDKNNVNDVYGIMSINGMDKRSRNCFISLLIDKKHQNKGLGKQALELFVYYILNEMNYYKVKMSVCEDNVGSRRLCEYIGADLEGKLKHEIYKNGEFFNVLMYAITKGPFNKSFKKKLSEREL